MKILNQKISVPFDYPVVFTHAAFDPANHELVRTLNRLQEKRPQRVMFFVDSGVAGRGAARACPVNGQVFKRSRSLIGQIKRYCAAHVERLELVAPPRIVPGGETLKNDLRHALNIARDLLAHHMDRHAVVVMIGGGAVLDAVGFAAALVHRGLRIVRLPTTVLAQCDSGVGVKNAVNFGAAKNLLGTFSPPFAVINDLNFLATLSDRDWRGGIAEAFKVALIQDAAFFRWLCRHAARFGARDAALMEQLIFRCARLHLAHIRKGGDPFEVGQARPLDFGHWSAHRLEVLSSYSLGHGQAVAVGIALDGAYAVRLGHLAAKDFRALVHGLLQAGLPVWYPAMARRAAGQLAILQGLEEFREHLGGELALTLPRGVGRRLEIHAVDKHLMEECVDNLKRLNSSAGLPG